MALSTQRASTSGTSAEWAPPHWKHDVFLSFRGEDTRRGFISHLYHELQYWQAIKTFKDDRDLEIGASISPELLTAIKQSHLAIIILSPNYASSTWCLDELSKILECMKDSKRIIPIFYEVDPYDVRNRRASFTEAFTKHEEKFSEDVDKVKRWRDALKEVANLSGLDSKNYQCERELIKVIVKRVWTKVTPFRLLDSQEKLVGIDFALEQLRLQLDSRNDIVEMHDLIQEMAWEIVRQECIQEPGQRSLLWLRDDISCVIINNTGTRAIEAIGLRLPKLEEVNWNYTAAFSKMHGLRLLHFDNVIVSSAPKDLPNSLRTICWSWYPSKSLPSSFEPRFRVEPNMRDGKLSRLWDGAKVLPNLKFMDLSYSDQLTSTPDFTGIPNLEILWLDFCTSLVEVHPYVAVLKKLRYLDLTEKSGSAKRGKVVSNLCVLPIPPPTYRLNPCGKVSNQLYLTMDDLADKFGIGSLRLTTRQTFQIHGVLKRTLRL